MFGPRTQLKTPRRCCRHCRYIFYCHLPFIPMIFFSHTRISENHFRLLVFSCREYFIAVHARNRWDAGSTRCSYTRNGWWYATAAISRAVSDSCRGRRALYTNYPTCWLLLSCRCMYLLHVRFSAEFSSTLIVAEKADALTETLAPPRRVFRGHVSEPVAMLSRHRCLSWSSNDTSGSGHCRRRVDMLLIDIAVRMRRFDCTRFS